MSRTVKKLFILMKVVLLKTCPAVMVMRLKGNDAMESTIGTQEDVLTLSVLYSKTAC
jgi:hypothetical protein